MAHTMWRHPRSGASLRWLVCLAVASVAAPLDAYAQETPSDTLLTVGHYFDLESVGDPEISPDGSQIAFTRRWVNKLEDRYETTLWIMRSDGSHARVFAKGASPRWSPDGSRIAYLADGDPKGTQIFIRWVDGDPVPTQLTRADANAAIGDIKWAPDGKAIGFTMFVPKPAQWAIDMPKPPDSARWTKAPRIVETLHFREDRRGFMEEGHRHLFVAETVGGPARQITHGDWDVGARFDALSGPAGWDWAADGHTIVFDGSINGDGDYNYRASTINAVDVNTGATHALTHDQGVWTHPVVSPDGRHIAFVGYPETHDTYHTSGLYVMNADGGDVRPLTGTLDRDAQELHWAPDNSGVYFASDDKGTRNVMFASAGATPGVRPITGGPAIISLGSLSHTDVAAVTISTTKMPPEVARLDLAKERTSQSKTVASATPVQLTHVNEAALSRIHLGAVEEMWVTSSGGARIQ
jgi:Tol biopolymer transport system component